jgi:simple sugar transport system permease protein/ribose transport system permease protein
VTISGNLFALSAGPMAALFGIVFALLLQAGAGIVIALLATIVLAIVAGLLQGIVINVIRNPIITTIAYGAVFAGLAALLSRNTLIRVHDTSPLWFGTARPFGVPMQSWTFVILTIIASLLTVTTRIGRLMVLSGANRATAIASGLRVGLATNIAMALFSFGAAIVAIFSVAQFSLAKADQYSGLDIDSIASVLVGGIALRGGNGSPLQAALGAVLIAVLQNFMLLRGWSTGVRLLVVGIVVVLATTSFHLLQRRSR